MKPAPFTYHRPTALPDALAVLAEHPGNARVLAGGQSLMPMLAMRLTRLDQLVDINRIEELKGIRDTGSELFVGALTRYTEILESSLIASELPLLRDAIRHVAHHAIRNRGTIGGSMALADPAAETPAACLALKARVVARSLTGEREIPIDSFFHSLMSTALADDEILVGVKIRKRRAPVRHAFVEFARRRGDFAQAGIILAPSHSAIPEHRAVIFGVGSVAWRSDAIEHALAAGGLTADIFDALDQEVTDAIDEPDAINYKTQIVRTLAARAMTQLTQ